MGRVVHIQLNCCNLSLISSFEAPPPNLLPLSHSSAFILSSSVGSDRVILSGGVLFSALGIYNGEKFFPGYTISIDEVKVNGEVRELSGKEYTCSDDGNCTRVNLYNQWVTSVPDDVRCADGDNSGLSATVLSVKDDEILSTLEITFTYSAP